MLIEYAQHFNKGQGIGFVIFGTTINRRVLLACKWNCLRAQKLRFHACSLKDLLERSASVPFKIKSNVVAQFLEGRSRWCRSLRG